MKEPHPLNGDYDVTIMRNEFSGVFVQIGDNAHGDSVKAGDRVVIELIFRNRDSFYTVKGECNLSQPGLVLA